MSVDATISRLKRPTNTEPESSGEKDAGGGRIKLRRRSAKVSAGSPGSNAGPSRTAGSAIERDLESSDDDEGEGVSLQPWQRHLVQMFWESNSGKNPVPIEAINALPSGALIAIMEREKGYLKHQGLGYVLTQTGIKASQAFARRA